MNTFEKFTVPFFEKSPRLAVVGVVFKRLLHN
jgi:hypothetical protein